MSTHSASAAGQPAIHRVTLTSEDVQEVLHKLQILADNDDAEMPDGAPLTPQQRADLRALLPRHAGVWDVPQWAWKLIRDEMQDHCLVLRDIASDARRNYEDGQALRICKQATKFERLFA